MLSSVGCAGSGNCERAKYWIDQENMRSAYLDDWIDLFEVDEEGNPTRGIVVHKRVDDLEKYCWQTRIK